MITTRDCSKVHFILGFTLNYISFILCSIKGHDMLYEKFCRYQTEESFLSSLDQFNVVTLKPSAKLLEDCLRRCKSVGCVSIFVSQKSKERE